MKRIFDAFSALLGLLVLSPLLLAIAGAVAVTMGRPILYRQLRGGLQSRPFVFIKFRTMTNETAPTGELLPDSQRVTPLGRVLRSTSLDELPQLWSVLTGDMSLVGPRPLIATYLSRYGARERTRHRLRPGITGWAQIHGRNNLSWQDKFEHDIWYVEHWSFGLDCRILAITAWKVLKREGISRDGYATMPEFCETDVRPERSTRS